VFEEGRHCVLYHAELRVDIYIALAMNYGGFYLVNMSHLVNIYNLCYVCNIENVFLLIKPSEPLGH
jgi:hypothetical protein